MRLSLKLSPSKFWTFYCGHETDAVLDMLTDEQRQFCLSEKFSEYLDKRINFRQTAENSLKQCFVINIQNDSIHIHSARIITTLC